MRVEAARILLKWVLAAGGAVAIHAVLFFSGGSDFLPPTLDQPAATRVYLVALSSCEGQRDTEPVPPRPEAVTPPPLAVEDGPVEMAVPETASESDKTPVEKAGVDSVVAEEAGVDADGRFDVPPRLSRRIEPVYPIAARRDRREGDVICEARITAHGRVSVVRVVVGSGFPDFDEAALAALRSARFEPASLRGRSVESVVRLTLSFRLTGR